MIDGTHEVERYDLGIALYIGELYIINPLINLSFLQLVPGRGDDIHTCTTCSRMPGVNEAQTHTIER